MTNARIVALAFGLTFCVFLSSSRFDFVEYDDPDYVLQNVHMRDGLTVSNTVWAATSVGYAYNWHPLAWTSLMTDVSLLRAAKPDNPDTDWVYREQEDGKPKWSGWMTRLSNVMHLHNVLLHSLNAALLCVLLLILLQGRMSNVWALGFALLWALHPLRTEVVCWVSERKELLSVFWMLLAAICWVRRPGTDRPSTADYVLSLVCFAFALLAKPVAVTLPVVLFAWDWIFRRKVRILGILPFAILSALTCVLTMFAQVEATETGSQLSAASRVNSVFVAPLVYLRQTVWPADLSILYDKSPEFNIPAVIGGILLVVAILAIGIVWLVQRYRTRHAPLIAHPSLLDLAAFAIAWVYVGLLPMLGIVKVGYQEHNDRYTYWIGCGACAVLLMFLAELRPSIRRLAGRCSAGDAAKEWMELRKFTLGTFAVLLAVLSVLSYQRMQCWRNAMTILYDSVTKCWEGAIAKNLVLKIRHISPEAEAEGEWYLRECMTRHPTCGNAVYLAEYLLLCKPGNGEELEKLGMKSYLEAEQLIESVLLNEPDNKKALELREKLKERRGEK